MMTRSDLEAAVLDALKQKGGAAKIVDVAKLIWAEHRADLERSGDLFFTWQYDMRWAAKRLRDKGKIADVEDSPRGVWKLS